VLSANARRFFLVVPEPLGAHPALKLSDLSGERGGVKEARQLAQLLSYCAEALRR
jgi:hypothetical protein